MPRLETVALFSSTTTGFDPVIDQMPAMIAMHWNLREEFDIESTLLALQLKARIKHACNGREPVLLHAFADPKNNPSASQMLDHQATQAPRWIKATKLERIWDAFGGSIQLELNWSIERSQPNGYYRLIGRCGDRSIQSEPFNLKTHREELTAQWAKGTP